MVRCQVTGKIVPASECEYIVIKILKHKDADLNGFNPFNGTTVAEPNKLFSEAIVEPNKSIQVPDGAVLLTKEEMQPAPKPFMPPGIVALMREPGTVGADEIIRRA